MKIPFNDLSLQHKEIAGDIRQAFNRALKNSDYILGKDVALFEEEFARFCGARFGVGVSSGTAALFLALKALGIKEGDEVIVPSFTFIATALAVSYTGARPVFADVDEKTFNIDADKLIKLVNARTKAVIPVHLFGQPAEMADILEFSAKHGLKVIEDAAQAHGARIKMPDGWRPCGSIGDMGAFSFYPSKNMGGLGDGGMVLTNNQELCDSLKILRNCGRTSHYEHAVIGYNSRLDTLQAGILRAKLKRLAEWNKKRRNAAYLYNRLLSGVPGVITPFEAEGLEHIYHAYVIKVNKRGELAAALKAQGVPAMVYYPIPLHLQKAYCGLGYKTGDLPVCEKLSGEVLALPIFPHIKESQIKQISGIVKKCLSR